MRGMKLQFSTKTILLVIAGVAIGCAGNAAWSMIGGTTPISVALTVIATSTPLWMPFAFAAFAIGRKSLTAKTILALAIAEALSVGLCYVLWTYFIY
jgi:hypothetical protein